MVTSHDASQTIGPTKETMRNEIDMEISRLTKLLLEQSRRNTLAPISSIPPEILTKIFAEIPKYNGRSSDLLPAAQVCREWRRVAIEYPLLWTDIDLTPPGVTPQMLTWSRQAPIRVSIRPVHRSCSRRFMKFVTTFLSTNIHRIQKLLIKGLPVYDMEQVIRSLDHCAPLLDKAVVCASKYGEIDWAASSTIQARLFGGSAPRLDYLRIDRTAVLWASSVSESPRLTRLYLNCELASTTMPQTLLALAKMPCLRVLHIHKQCFPPCPAGYDGKIPVPSLRVTLANLCELELIGPLDGCSFLTSHLDFPRPGTDITIQASHLISSLTSSHLIHSIVAKVYIPDSELEIKCRDKAFSLTGSHLKLLLLVWDSPLPYIVETLDSLRTVSSDSAIRGMVFLTDCLWIQNHWTEILHRVPRLHHLHYHCGSPFTSFAAVANNIILPDLKKLSFSILDKDDHEAGLFNGVCQFLRSRRDLGAAISEVWIKEWDERTLTSEEEQQFQDLVEFNYKLESSRDFRSQDFFEM